MAEVETRIAATLNRQAKELRSVHTAQLATFAYVDALTKVLLTCIAEPPNEMIDQAKARAKRRYEKFLVSVAQNMARRDMTDHVGLTGLWAQRPFRDLGLSDSRATKRFQAATSDMEAIPATMARLVHLLARSRVVEWDIVDKQLGGFIRPDFLRQIQRDLEALVAETKQE